MISTRRLRARPSTVVLLATGWVSPLGDEGEALAHAAEGRILLKLKREERVLPAAVVREQVQAKVDAIESEEGRKVYRRERLAIKDEIVQDCLPRAFTRSNPIYACLDTRSNWLFVDAASAARAEELVNALRDCTGSLPLLLPQVNQAPAPVMTNWLLHRKLPEGLSLGQECELREPGEDGGVVRCRGVDLLTEEVETHLHAGRQVTRLAVSWEERLTLVLAEDLCLRRLRFADELMKENEAIAEADPLARMDADFALMADTLAGLQARILTLFGGEAA